MKKVLIVALVFLVAGFGYVANSKRVDAQTACDATKVKVLPINTLNSTIVESQENVPVLKFRIKNENLTTTCGFNLNNVHLQELLQYNGSVVEDLVLMQGTTAVADFEVEKFGSEIIYRLPMMGVNVSVAPNTLKEFTVVANGFENKPEEHGVYFALGVEFVKGSMGTLQVNNWQVPAKWGQIFFITQQ